MFYLILISGKRQMVCTFESREDAEFYANAVGAEQYQILPGYEYEQQLEGE